MNTYPQCPYCGESYYAENYSTTTAMYWAPIYRNGVLINENPNTTTTYCTCCNCGKSFSYTNKDKFSSEMQTPLDSSISWTSIDTTTMPILS